MRSWAGAPDGISRQSAVSVGGFKPRIETGSSNDARGVAVLVRLGRLPKLLCLVERVNPEVGPPCSFIAMAMQRFVVLAAQPHSELVADLAPQRSRLGKLQMVGIARRALADQAALRAHKCQMGLIAAPDLFAQRRHPVLGLQS